MSRFAGSLKRNAYSSLRRIATVIFCPRQPLSAAKVDAGGGGRNGRNGRDGRSDSGTRARAHSLLFIPHSALRIPHSQKELDFGARRRAQQSTGEVTGARWLSRSSKPWCRNSAAGGFNSHSPPPFPKQLQTSLVTLGNPSQDRLCRLSGGYDCSPQGPCELWITCHLDFVSEDIG